MNDNPNNLNTKGKRSIKIKKTSIIYKPKKVPWKEEEKTSTTPNLFARNLNTNTKPVGFKAFSPIPQRFNSNFDINSKQKLK